MSEPLTDFERRASPLRVAVDTANDRLIRGTAIVFDSLSKVMHHRDVGKFRERIRHGAVDRTLREARSIKALWNHNDDWVLGNTKSGTLLLRKTPKGLAVEIDPPKWANPHLETIERGDVDGMSFGFRPIEVEWDVRTSDGIPTRDVLDMEFAEVSIVAFQAYEGTDVNLSTRSLELYAEVQARHQTDWRQQFAEIRKIANG